MTNPIYSNHDLCQKCSIKAFANSIDSCQPARTAQTDPSRHLDFGEFSA